MSEFDNTVYDFFKTYQDRGMKKWQGLMLSDHTSAINRSKQQIAKIYQKKPTMSEEQAGELLMTAYANHKQVTVQLKELDLDGCVKPDIIGHVQGYYVEKIMISGKEIELSNINHVALI